MRLHLLVFDLDGTIVDSRSDLVGGVNVMLAGLGGEALPSLTVASMVGEGAAVLVDRALTAAGIEADRDVALRLFLDIYDRCLLDQTDCYPGLRQALEAATRHDIGLAVLTNKPERSTRRILEGLDLSHFFTAVVGGDGPFPRKPDPAGLEHLVQAAHVSPGTTLFVGDSSLDLETARRAGVRFCAARYGFGWTSGVHVDERSLTVDSPYALERLIEDLAGRRP